MAKNKIERIDQEIAKVREKIAEYQETHQPRAAKGNHRWHRAGHQRTV